VVRKAAGGRTAHLFGALRACVGFHAA
jgi:hypothetical protein